MYASMCVCVCTNRPLSRSLALIVATEVPGAAVSETNAVYVGLLNDGALSLTSAIVTVTVAVDENFVVGSTSSAIT